MLADTNPRPEPCPDHWCDGPIGHARCVSERWSWAIRASGLTMDEAVENLRRNTTADAGWERDVAETCERGHPMVWVESAPGPDEWRCPTCDRQAIAELRERRDRSAGRVQEERR